MTRDIETGREEFLKLSTGEIRGIVLSKSKPKAGIFVADGNRRLVMCRTRLSPTSERFYNEYARFFVESLKKTLIIFFDHGLETLFFPLFGPSLLLRKNKFQSITIPAAYREIFQSNEWLRFYKENSIRVKSYGDLTNLEKIEVNRLNMAGGIKRMIEKTSSHHQHTLYFGFMSENTPGLEMPQMIIDFYKSHNRQPTPREILDMYYGEPVIPADFLVFSNKFSTPGAVPPLVCTSKTKMYYLPVPGFLGFNTLTYRKILYDQLFIQPRQSVSEYSDDQLKNIEALDKFYRDQKDTIIGTGKTIGQFLVPDI